MIELMYRVDFNTAALSMGLAQYGFGVTVRLVWARSLTLIEGSSLGLLILLIIVMLVMIAGCALGLFRDKAHTVRG